MKDIEEKQGPYPTKKWVYFPKWLQEKVENAEGSLLDDTKFHSSPTTVKEEE